MRTWQIKNDLLTASNSRPLIMGILNVTPDSFSDGGSWFDADSALKQADVLAQQHVDIIDIGGQSTRPGYTVISAQEEWQRLEQIFKLIHRRSDLPPISVDTFYPEVAEKALYYGAQIINDVTGFDSADMRRLAAETGCGCVIMHHADISNCANPIAEVREFFERCVKECADEGIKPEKIALDIGIGFGKTREQEIELFKHCGECRVDNLPMLVGASRKRVIAYLMNDLESKPSERDEMTHIVHVEAFRAGADIIRVHDVAGAINKLSK